MSEQSVKPLKRRVFRAGGWTMAGHVTTLALRLLSSIILTRLFSPDVFGLLAIIAALGTLIGLLTDIGLRQAVVQTKHVRSLRFLHTAFSVQVLRGLFVWLCCVLFAASLSLAGWMGLLQGSSVYAQPLLPELFVVASLSSVILGFQSMKAHIAARDLKLGRITLIELVAFLAGLFVIIPLGFLSRSIWSYIVGMLLSSLINVLLSHVWLRGPKDGFAWDKEALAEIRHFGKWIFLSSAVTATILNADRMYLAAILSPIELGLYSIANNLANIPDALASKLFGSVVMPTLSEVNRSTPQRFSVLFWRMRWLSDSLMLFVAGLLFASGVTIVHVLYDPRYANAGWMLQWLSFSLVFARYNIAGSAYLAIGRPQHLSTIAAVRAVSLFICVALGFWAFGVNGTIIGISFHMAPSALIMIYFNWRLGIGSVRSEILLLPTWVLGWLTGVAINTALLAFGLNPHGMATN